MQCDIPDWIWILEQKKDMSGKHEIRKKSTVWLIVLRQCFFILTNVPQLGKLLTLGEAR